MPRGLLEAVYISPDLASRLAEFPSLLGEWPWEF